MIYESEVTSQMRKVGQLQAADRKFLKSLKLEASYPHWTEEQRRMLELCIKWFCETHEIKE